MTQPIILTASQAQALPDLVAFAITGYALMSAMDGPTAQDHPVIAPFIPLVRQHEPALIAES